MKQLYKIKSITHTGTRGEKGTPRTGGHWGQHYDEWTGMTIEFDDEEYYLGTARILYYKNTAEGIPKKGWMHTSHVNGEVHHENGDVELITLNSVYYLEKING